MLPIACSLDATDLAQRQEDMRAAGRDALLGARIELRFAPAARGALESIVEAESRCCAFLTMDVSEADDELVLTVTGPRGAEVVLAGMVQAFAG